jgi:hypothetical protein
LAGWVAGWLALVLGCVRLDLLFICFLFLSPNGIILCLLFICFLFLSPNGVIFICFFRLLFICFLFAFLIVLKKVCCTQA